MEINDTNTGIRCESCDREFGSQDGLASHNAAKHNIPLTSSGSASNNSSENSGISKKTIFFIMGILAIAAIGYFFLSKGSLTGNASSGEVQKITLSFKDYNYYPNTINVESGKPVEITLDSSIRGCFRAFNIKDLGVNYRSSSPSDTIKFTPGKKGSFEFACGMRMGYGTIIVN